MKLLSIFPTERNRWFTHIGLALLTLVWWYVYAGILPDDYRDVRVLTIASGYLSLLYLVVTLLIGPIQLIRKKRKRNPVNINLRRDIGIWTALVGLVHVIAGFQVHLQGQILLYFFNDTADFQPRFNLFGVSNYLGLIATVILLLLLFLSNDISLRRLKAGRWKNLQRLNYALIILVLAHTIGYESLPNQAFTVQTFTLLLTLLLLAFQAAGYFLTRARSKS